MEEITAEDIQELLLHFSRNTYRANNNDAVCQRIMQRCISLAALDYNTVIVNNAAGELSAHYPSQLIIMESERNGKSASVPDYSARGPSEFSSRTNPFLGTDHSSRANANSTIYESVYDGARLKDLFHRARFARCRARFPLPVILYKGKNICRSATLASGPEIYGRSGFDYLFGAEVENMESTRDEESNENLQQGDWLLFDKVRSQDIRLLKTLNVGAIIDFMVEKKKVKFGVKVTSSEKVDKESRYSDFTIMSLPYPGCEFFKEFRDNDYEGKGLVFDWSQAHVDALIGIPEDNIVSQLKIDWENYKEWDLVKLTANYMELLVRYLVDQPLGLLIHCISGWDRTPLFVSLLRLSLWADGAIHQSLSEQQILYFTVAYDWMLFGHDLSDRISKGEDIFIFCFYFLKHILAEDFSVTKVISKQRNNSVLRADSETQLEGLFLDADAPISSQGSNISLNSSWSSASSRSHETPPVFFQAEDQGLGLMESSTCQFQRQDSFNVHQPKSSDSESSSPETGSSGSTVTDSASTKLRPHGPRTSPMAVPMKSSNRQRNESTGSLNAGSWHVVSGTGSLRGSGSGGSNSTCGSHFNLHHSRTQSSDSQPMGDSTSTLIEGDCARNANSPESTQRFDRLQTVRRLFFTNYCSTVGIKLKDGMEDSRLSNFLGNIAEKVGFISGPRTSV